MARIEEAQKANHAFSNQMNRAAFALASELNQLAQAHSESFRQIAEQQAAWSRSGAAAALERASAAASKLAQIDWEAMAELTELANRLPKIHWEAVARNIADGAEALALLGWFLPLAAPYFLYRELLEKIEAGQWEECECELEEHYEAFTPVIREELLEQFPERREFLERAFTHHEEGNYHSAIPLFLIQSDGIGESILGTSIFQKENVKKWVDPRVKGQGWFEPFWRLIHQILPINAHTTKLGGYRNPLNRHAVLHGKDLTYATRRNSFKAIAWLQYIASFASLDRDSN